MKRGPKNLTNWGGVRIPSEETMDKYLIELTVNQNRKMELLRAKRPRQIRIYEKDLKRLRAIGGGDWLVGFQNALNIARECWLTTDELKRLKALNPHGTQARGGLLHIMEQAEKEMK